MQRILTCVFALTLLGGCASSPTLRDARTLSAIELSSIGSVTNVAATKEKSTKPEELVGQWECDGPVELEVAVYPLQIVNGDKSANLNSIWYITSPDKLYSTETPKEMPFTDDQITNKTMLHSIKLITQPGPKGAFTIGAYVYDRNEIGDSTASELKAFTQKVTIASGNIYPAADSGIPILSDVVDLGIGFVNLFRSNYPMCELSETIVRTDKQVVFWAGKRQKAYCAFDVIPRPLFVTSEKNKCGPTKKIG